jgi:hypothetical protein
VTGNGAKKVPPREVIRNAPWIHGAIDLHDKVHLCLLLTESARNHT